MFVVKMPAIRGSYIHPQDRYAVHDPIEGWIFTILFVSAEKFRTREDAEQALATHYKGHEERERLRIEEVKAR